MDEKEYIERKVLIRHLNDEIKECGDACADFRPVTYGTILGLMGARSFANTLPAADVAPVVHAEWVVEEERTGNYSHCSRCGIRCQGYAPNYKYCPHCGAKMDGGKHG